MDKGGGASGSATTMDAQQHPSSNDYHNEFYNTGRVGRRNAMPDILGQHCTTTTADLPDKLGALTTQDNSSVTITSVETGQCISSKNIANTNGTGGTGDTGGGAGGGPSSNNAS